jgi:hypothetical protein
LILTQRRVLGHARLQIDDHEGTVAAVAQDVDLSGGRAMLAPLVDDLQPRLEPGDGLAQGPLQVPLEAEGGDDRVLDLVCARPVLDLG